MPRLMRLATCLLAVLGAGPGAAFAQERPNLVLIVADDLGWGDVGWHGGPFATPNLDRLVRAGVELDQHYVSPMCSPTRAALLSGRYASRFGVTGAQNERAFPFDTQTLARTLKTAGYDTALVGKWHLGSRPEWGPNLFGFDHSYGSLAGGCGPYDHRYKVGPFTETWQRNGRLIAEEGHITDLIAKEAADWLAARGSRPFFLYVAFTAVHIPIDEPKPWLDRYASIPDPARRQYAACVTHLDDAVGRIVAALDQSGRRQRTLIVFTSDNGAPPNARNDDPQYPGRYTPGAAGGSNAPLRGQKTQLYEGGIRVPALASWPGKLKPGRFLAPIHAVDWMPTFCALAGVPPLEGVRWDGRNLWPWLTGAESPAPRALYWAGVGFRASAVRDGDWKLIVTRDGNKAELFNLAADPYERTDLAAAQPERVAQMRQRLADLARHDHDASPR